MKRKQKKKHLEKNASTPSAKKSRDSKILTPVLETSGSTQGHGQQTPDSSENVGSNISSDKITNREPQEFKEVVPEPPVVAPPWTQATRGKSLASENFNRVSFARNLIPTEVKNPQELAPEPRVLAFVLTKPAGENASASEYLACDSCARKLIPIGFQMFQQIAPDPRRMNWIPVSRETSISGECSRTLFSTRKHISTEFQKWKKIATEKYALETSMIQVADFNNRKESTIEPHILEAASTQAAGQRSFDSARRFHPTNEHDLQKWDVITNEPPVLEEASTQPARKHSPESDHLISPFSTNKLFPTQRPELRKWKQAAIKRYMLETARSPGGDHSSESEYFTCFSTFSKLLPTEEHEFPSFKGIALAARKQEAAGENSSDSEYFSCVSTPRKFPSTEKPGFQKCQEFASSPWRDPCTQKAGERSSSSEYFTVSPTKHISKGQQGLQKCQELTNASQMPDPVRGPAAEDNSSSSEYFTCVSSEGQLLPIDKRETSELHSCVPYPETRAMPLVHKLEESECSSPLAYNEFPVYTTNDPCTPPQQRKRERVMKVYYMHVRLKRGVAALEDTDEGQPSRKKTKMEIIAFPETIHTEEKLSNTSTKELLTESDFSLDDVSQESTYDDDIPMDSPILETSPRAKTPEWLVARDSGYRCMGCCRVFASLEILQDHVQNGIKEGFSCHSFHLALDWLRSKKTNEKKKYTKKRKTKSKRAGQKGKQSKKTTSPCT